VIILAINQKSINFLHQGLKMQMSQFQSSVKVFLFQKIGISTALKISLTLFEIQYKSNKNFLNYHNLHVNKTGKMSFSFRPE
jgi:hypothetical protein